VSIARGRQTNVFVDMCTQRDYLSPTGARPSPIAPFITPRIRHLMAFARWARIPTLSCVDVRRPDEVRGIHGADCVLGTPGQRKLSCTLLRDHVRIDSDNCLCVSLEILRQHQQAILAKQHRDPFTNPKLDRLLTEMPVQRFVVFGVGLETSIRLLVLGLLLRHRRVAVVQDACGWWDAEAGDMALRQLAAKGCELVTTQDLVESALGQYRRKTPRYRRRYVA
jgi:nicotinamidase-related amidase